MDPSSSAFVASIEPTDFARVYGWLGTIREHIPDIGGICSRLEIAPCPVFSMPVPETRGLRCGLPENCRGPPLPGGSGCFCQGISAREHFRLGSRWLRPFAEAGEEGAGQHDRHRALQYAGEHQRQPEAPDGSQATRGQGPTGAAPQTRPRQAPPTRPIRLAGVSLWRREMAMTDPAPTANPTREKAGPASSQPGAAAMIR